MSGRTAYVTHSDCSRHDTGWRHPEHQGRLPAVARAVHRDMLVLFERLLEVEGEPVAEEVLRLAHSADYVSRVRQRCEEAAQLGRVLPLHGDVMVSGASWEALTAAVGCVVTATELVRSGGAANAFCAVRPPGHGAGRASPGLYGIFNGVAVAALGLAAGAMAERVLVVEWSSRAGTGTAEIVRDHPSIGLLSVHAAGEGALEPAPRRVVRGLSPGASCDAALAALRDGWDEAERSFRPDIVLLALGCDALAGDPLGVLDLRPADYYRLTAELRERVERVCGGRLVSVLEEGYEVGEMGQAVVQHLRALAALPPPDS